MTHNGRLSSQVVIVFGLLSDLNPANARLDARERLFHLLEILMREDPTNQLERYNAFILSDMGEQERERESRTSTRSPSSRGPIIPV